MTRPSSPASVPMIWARSAVEADAQPVNHVRLLRAGERAGGVRTWDRPFQVQRPARRKRCPLAPTQMGPTSLPAPSSSLGCACADFRPLSVLRRLRPRRGVPVPSGGWSGSGGALPSTWRFRSLFLPHPSQDEPARVASGTGCLMLPVSLAADLSPLHSSTGLPCRTLIRRCRSLGFPSFLQASRNRLT